MILLSRGNYSYHFEIHRLRGFPPPLCFCICVCRWKGGACIFYIFNFIKLVLYTICCFVICFFLLKNIYLLFIYLIYFRLHRVLVAACGLFVAACGLLSSCGMWVFSSLVVACSLQGVWAVQFAAHGLQLKRVSSVVVVCRLSCPLACGILVSLTRD